jgi:pyridoxal phosphate enzyme (YggS family)
MGRSIASGLASVKGNMDEGVTLVAVSKTKPIEDIMAAYQVGQRIFGENRPQEMKAKFEALPKDIQWHMIGRLQRNKVKYIIPFVSLIHSVDSERLLKEIDKRSEQAGRVVDVLLQAHIAIEETKAGMDFEELNGLLSEIRSGAFQNVRCRGLMGMATLSEDLDRIRAEFEGLAAFFDDMRSTQDESFDILSMGMSGDYQLAIECGSNMVRIGSAIFGSRNG